MGLHHSDFIDLARVVDDDGHPLRLTTCGENIRLARKRRKAKRFLRQNHAACDAALASVMAARRQPGREG